MFRNTPNRGCFFLVEARSNIDDDVLTSLAGRLARMEHRLSADDDKKIRAASGGYSLKDLAHRIVQALDPDHVEAASRRLAEKRPEAASTSIREQIEQAAVKPLHDPKLRELLAELKRKNEITIDHVSADEVLESGFSKDALDRARGMVQSFEQFIEQHKDEITALQSTLQQTLQTAPHLRGHERTRRRHRKAALAVERLRRAGKIQSQRHRRQAILTDLVSLVRHAIHQDNELIPFPERVNANFKTWVEAASRRLNQRQDAAATGFTAEQLKWLEMIRDHIAARIWASSRTTSSTRHSHSMAASASTNYSAINPARSCRT